MSQRLCVNAEKLQVVSRTLSETGPRKLHLPVFRTTGKLSIGAVSQLQKGELLVQDAATLQREPNVSAHAISFGLNPAHTSDTENPITGYILQTQEQSPDGTEFGLLQEPITTIDLPRNDLLFVADTSPEEEEWRLTVIDQTSGLSVCDKDPYIIGQAIFSIIGYSFKP